MNIARKSIVVIALFGGSFSLLTMLHPAPAQTTTSDSASQQNVALPVTPKEKIVLFNGKDISGWHLYLGTAATVPATAPASQPAGDAAKVWTVTDGVLKLDAKSAGYLLTDKAYANYKLHVEWRWPKDGVARSNSGILLHTHGGPSIWPLCFEAQLQNGNAGQLTGMALDIPDAPMQNNRKRAGRGPGVTEKPMGEWNTYEIVAIDDTLTLTINGTQANSVGKLPVRAGAIGLQMEGFPIEFRNVWVEPARK